MRIFSSANVCAASLLAAGVAFGSPAKANASVVPGEILARSGQPLDGLPPVTDLFTPWVEADGTPAFSGQINDSEDLFIWRDGAVIWDGRDHADESAVLFGGIATAPGDAFVGRLAIDPASGALWTEDGLVLNTSVATPGLPAHDSDVHAWRAQIASDGSLFWQYRRGTQIEYVMRALTGDPADAEIVFERGGSLGGGLSIPDEFSSMHDFEVSPNGAHVLTEIRVAGPDVPSGTTGDTQLWLDDAIVTPDSPGIFGITHFVVDDDGHWAVAADLTGSTADQVVMLDGVVAVAEGDVVLGHTIPTGAEISAVALDGNGNAAHVWEEGNDEVALATCGFADASPATLKVIEPGDEIDLDGDQIGDFTVDSIADHFLDTTHFFGGDGRLLLNVFGEGESVILHVGPVCCTGAGCCGNGMLDQNEECDDGNPDATDACTTNCTTPVCGDGFVHAATEECDDGNDDDEDACSNTCVASDDGGSSSGSTGGDGSTSDGGSTGEDGEATGSGNSSEGGATGGGTSGEGPDPSAGEGSSSEASSGTTDSASPGSATASGSGADGSDTDTDDVGLDDADGCACAAGPSAEPSFLALLGLMMFGLRRRT